MKHVAHTALDCIKRLLPNIAAAGLFSSVDGMASGAVAAGGGAAAVAAAGAGIAAAPLALAGACIAGYVGLHRRKGMKEEGDLRSFREALNSLAHVSYENRDKVEKTVKKLGFELRGDIDVVRKRLEVVEGLVRLEDSSDDALLGYLRDHEGLFVSLEQFLVKHFKELREAGILLQGTVEEVRQSVWTLRFEFAALREDFKALARIIVEKYERSEDDLRQMIADRDERIAELETALREVSALANDGDKEAERAIAALRDAGDLELLQKFLARVADERYAVATERHREAQERYIEHCREVANIAFVRGDMDEAEARAHKILELAPHDPATINLLGLIYFVSGDLDAAWRQCDHLLNVAGEDEDLRAAAFSGLGTIAHAREELGEATTYFLASLEINRELGDLNSEAANLHTLGVLARKRGDIEEARQFFEASFEIYRELGNLGLQSVQLQTLGLLAQARGDLKVAAQHFQSSLEIDTELGDLKGQSMNLHMLGVLARLRGNLDEATRCCLASLVIDTESGDPEGQSDNYYQLGLIAQTNGDLNESERLLNVALEIDRRSGDLDGQSLRLGTLGTILAMRKDLEGAQRILREALEIDKQLGNVERQVMALVSLSRFAKVRGEYMEARRLSIELVELMTRVETPEMESKVRTLLHELLGNGDD